MTENTENRENPNQQVAGAGGGENVSMAEKIAAIESVAGKDSDITAELKESIAPKPTEQQAPPQETPGQPQEAKPFVPEQFKQKAEQTEAFSQPDNTPQPKTEVESLQESQDASSDSAHYVLESEIYGGKKTFGQTEKSVDTEGFDAPEELNNFVKSKYEHENFNSLMDDYGIAKAKADELDIYKADYEKTANDIANLPRDLQEALSSYANGQDYTSAFKKERLNYNLDFKEHDIKKVVDHYFQDNVKAEDWEQADRNSDEYDPRAERLVETYVRDAQDKYNNERNGVRTEAEAYRGQMEQVAQDRVDSVGTAMDAYKKEYPNSTSAYNDKIYNALNNNEMDRMLRNPDGTYTPEAAILFVEMTEGKNLRTQLTRIAAEKATSSANEEILSRGASQPRMTGGGQPLREESDAFKQQMEEIDRLDGNNTF